MSEFPSELPAPTKAILVLAGPMDLSEREIIKLMEATHMIICADGAARSLLERRIWPDVVIGDLDSLLPADQKKLSDNDVEIILCEDQSTSDCEKAIIWLLDNQIREVAVIGIGGGRSDHTLANYNVLMRYAERFQLLKGVEAENEILFLPRGGEMMITGWPGRRISFIPFPAMMNVRSTGLKYPLIGDFMIGARESLSNEMLANTAKITAAAGAMLAFLEQRK